MGVPMAGWLAGCSTTDPGGPAGSAGGNLLERAREEGLLRVAIGNEPPYTKMEGDTVTGVEPDVLRAVAKRHGIDELEGVTTAYESMIPGLQAGRWDVVAAGLFLKQSRCSQVAYTEPVIVSTESFAVPPGNPKGITTVQDILDNPDLRVGVLPGAFEEGILESAGVPKDQWVSVPDGRGGISAVKAGRADAFFLPTLSLEALAEDDSGFEITDVVEDALKTGSGAAFHADATMMVEEYNKVGMVFQSFNLFPHMTAIENAMEAPVQVLKMPKDEAHKRAEELMEMVGLSQHLDHKPPEMSGGQQQRVAIARALAMRPKILLFDEPTSALDPELIGEVLAVIGDLAHSADMTMLMVTHEMRFAEEISDRVVMFDSGAVVEEGPPEKIFEDPSHERTRLFLRAVLER